MDMENVEFIFWWPDFSELGNLLVVVRWFVHYYPQNQQCTIHYVRWCGLCIYSFDVWGTQHRTKYCEVDRRLSLGFH